MQTNRQTHGIVVTLYRGKVVTRQSGSTMRVPGETGRHGRAGAQDQELTHGREAESWRELAGS